MNHYNIIHTERNDQSLLHRYQQLLCNSQSCVEQHEKKCAQ
jgi:hypothetical protein